MSRQAPPPPLRRELMYIAYDILYDNPNIPAGHPRFWEKWWYVKQKYELTYLFFTSDETDPPTDM